VLQSREARFFIGQHFPQHHHERGIDLGLVQERASRRVKWKGAAAPMAAGVRAL
jgi:hypothetical protein